MFQGLGDPVSTSLSGRKKVGKGSQPAAILLAATWGRCGARPTPSVAFAFCSAQAAGVPPMGALALASLVSVPHPQSGLQV